MSVNTEYPVVAGFVQFPPREREVNGSTLRDITIQVVGTQKNITLNLWPEWEGVDIAQGDFVAAQGKSRVNEFKGNKYINISVQKLVRIPGLQPPDRKVENPIRKSEDLAF